MNEEMNLETIETMDEVFDTDVETDVSGNGAGIIIGAICVGVVGLAAGLAWKYRHKFEEMRIRSLEKKGYVVSKPEEVVEVEAEEVSES